LLSNKGKDKPSPVAFFCFHNSHQYVGLLMTLPLRAGTLNVRAIGDARLVVMAEKTKIKNLGEKRKWAQTFNIAKPWQWKVQY